MSKLKKNKYLNKIMSLLVICLFTFEPMAQDISVAYPYGPFINNNFFSTELSVPIKNSNILSQALEDKGKIQMALFASLKLLSEEDTQINEGGIDIRRLVKIANKDIIDNASYYPGLQFFIYEAKPDIIICRLRDNPEQLPRTYNVVINPEIYSAFCKSKNQIEKDNLASKMGVKEQGLSKTAQADEKNQMGKKKHGKNTAIDSLRTKSKNLFNVLRLNMFIMLFTGCAFNEDQNIIFNLSRVEVYIILITFLLLPLICKYMLRFINPIYYWVERLPEEKAKKALLEILAVKEQNPDYLFWLFNDKKNQENIQDAILDVLKTGIDFQSYLRTRLEKSSSYSDSNWRSAKDKVKTIAFLYIKFYGIPEAIEENRAILRSLSLVDEEAEKRLFQISYPVFVPLLEVIDQSNLSTKRFIYRTIGEVTQGFASLFDEDDFDKACIICRNVMMGLAALSIPVCSIMTDGAIPIAKTVKGDLNLFQSRLKSLISISREIFNSDEISPGTNNLSLILRQGSFIEFVTIMLGYTDVLMNKFDKKGNKFERILNTQRLIARWIFSAESKGLSSRLIKNEYADNMIDVINDLDTLEELLRLEIDLTGRKVLDQEAHEDHKCHDCLGNGDLFPFLEHIEKNGAVNIETETIDINEYVHPVSYKYPETVREETVKITYIYPATAESFTSPKDWKELSLVTTKEAIEKIKSLRGKAQNVIGTSVLSSEKEEEERKDSDSMLQAAIEDAADTGIMIPTNIYNGRYILLVGDSIGTRAELEKDSLGYNEDEKHIGFGDRFDVEIINTSKMKYIIEHVKWLMNGKDRKYRSREIIIKIDKSQNFTEEEISDLKSVAPNVRLIRIDTTYLKRVEDEIERRKFRFNVYAMMLAARKISIEDLDSNTAIYRTLRLYFSNYYNDGENGEDIADSFINALLRDEIFEVIKYTLSFIPAGKWSAEESYRITIALVSA